MNILLIEDERRVADFIARGLRGEGWTIEHVVNGEDALERLLQHSFDVIVLDLMLPGISGQEVCRTLRARGIHTPVLMLSALDAVTERVAGLRMGADDYLTKPFDFDELVARIAALERRQSDFRGVAGDAVLRVGGVTLDPTSLRVRVDDVEIELTARERDLLMLFMTHPDKVFARERILNSVWGTQQDPLTNVVDVFVGRLRKKLGARGSLIQTVRGSGYRFGG